MKGNRNGKGTKRIFLGNKNYFIPTGWSEVPLNRYEEYELISKQSVEGEEVEDKEYKLLSALTGIKLKDLKSIDVEVIINKLVPAISWFSEPPTLYKGEITIELDGALYKAKDVVDFTFGDAIDFEITIQNNNGKEGLRKSLLPFYFRRFEDGKMLPIETKKIAELTEILYNNLGLTYALTLEHNFFIWRNTLMERYADYFGIKVKDEKKETPEEEFKRLKVQADRRKELEEQGIDWKEVEEKEAKEKEMVKEREAKLNKRQEPDTSMKIPPSYNWLYMIQGLCKELNYKPEEVINLLYVTALNWLSAFFLRDKQLEEQRKKALSR